MKKIYLTVLNWFCLFFFGFEVKEKQEDPYDPAVCLPKLKGKPVEEIIGYLYEKARDPSDKNHYIFQAFNELGVFHYDAAGLCDIWRRNFANCHGSVAYSFQLRLDNFKNLQFTVSFYKPATYPKDSPMDYVCPECIELVLSEKATKEIFHACTKVNNLYDRFADQLTNIDLIPLDEKNEVSYEGEVQSIGLGIKYKLLDEDRYFTAYYKSNMFKKKLNGAGITAKSISDDYVNTIIKINKIWEANGSSLKLVGDMLDPTKTTLNGMPFITTLKPFFAMAKDICSEEFFEAMINLLKHDVYLVRVNSSNESQLVMDPKVNADGLIEFKPVFKMDTTVLAVSIAATKLNTRLNYEPIRC